MSSEAYKLYRKHQVEIFDMIYDTIERAPVPDNFGTETKEEREEFDKKMKNYLKIEEPKIKERFKELGFNINEEV